jgi:hypothetical protein
MACGSCAEVVPTPQPFSASTMVVVLWRSMPR